MATIAVLPGIDLVKIVTAAGQPDVEKRSYHNGVLKVLDVTQRKLEAVLANYNYLEAEVEVAALNAAAQREQLLAAADKASAGCPTPLSLACWVRMRRRASGVSQPKSWRSETSISTSDIQQRLTVRIRPPDTLDHINLKAFFRTG